MTINEMLETLREGNAVTCDDRLYMKIENGRFIERSQESGEVVLASSCVLISIDDVLRNETNYRIYKNPILNDKEKEYLRAVIKPFKDSVQSITKKSLVTVSTNESSTITNTCASEFISIRTKNETGISCTINLPYFSRGDMYRAMINDKNYTLEELGL